MNKYPWKCCSDLTKERLTEIANFIAGIRDEVIELHDECLGDTRLALGMRAYECCRSRINRESEGSLFPYLSKLTIGGRFTFCIGETPVRFTRNDPKCLPDRKLIVSEETMKQMSLFGDQTHAEIRWFFVFDTDYRSAADAVYFVGYSEVGEIICQWQIPIEEHVTLISDAAVSIPKAVELDKPLIGVKRPAIKVDTSENGN